MKLLLLVSLFLAGLALNASAATVTAYCPCRVCCGVMGGTGLTASGKAAKQGVTVAASRGIPFGTRLRIEGVGVRVVQDRLAARFDNRVDVYFSRHEDAVRFGKKNLNVRISK